jgi:hypothetical protein
VKYEEISKRLSVLQDKLESAVAGVQTAIRTTFDSIRDVVDELVESNEQVARSAQKVLEHRMEAGQLDPADIERIVQGRFYYYVCFSNKWADKAHPHGGHPGGYAVIENAQSLEEARYIARKEYGPGHLVPIHESEWDFRKQFPLGVLKTINAEDYRRVN